MSSEVRWLSPEEQRLWRRWLRLNAQLNATLHREMQDDSGLSHPDFEVLVNLTDSPEGRVRVSDLACQMLWERSRLSHHVTRMERRGLVRRAGCVEDGRGAFIEITEQGRATIERAAPAMSRRSGGSSSTCSATRTPPSSRAWSTSCSPGSMRSTGRRPRSESPPPRLASVHERLLDQRVQGDRRRGQGRGVRRAGRPGPHGRRWHLPGPRPARADLRVGRERPAPCSSSSTRSRLPGPRTTARPTRRPSPLSTTAPSGTCASCPGRTDPVDRRGRAT